ncbi:MAG: hypothetical protein Q8898_12425 [Bacillota bacterium]|nr:hypothetical protein [Bacillota bacterium]
MEEIVRAFNETVKGKKHLIELFRDSPEISILYKIENEVYVIELDHIYANEITAEKFIIIGKFDAFQELLTGNNKLRNLVDQGRLEIKASFRNLLKLESIFFLTSIEIKRTQFI